MKIAFLIGDFPSLSETFILDQITGLLQQGCQIDIYATRPKSSTKIHSKIDQYQLLENVYYYPNIPNLYPIRFLKLVLLIFINFLKDPIIILRSLNIFRHYRLASSLRLFYATVPFIQRRPHYDVIQCHFGNNGILGLKLRQIGAISGKLYTTFHGRDMSHYLAEAGDRVYSELFSEGDFFLPISEHWRKRLIELG
ncbi:MAG: colanic acid biosynthesis glycosyltransferase WcaL, partial [Thermosynechococcaceae cyanobacterium]